MYEKDDDINKNKMKSILLFHYFKLPNQIYVPI